MVMSFLPSFMYLFGRLYTSALEEEEEAVEKCLIVNADVFFFF